MLFEIMTRILIVDSQMRSILGPVYGGNARPRKGDWKGCPFDPRIAINVFLNGIGRCIYLLEHDKVSDAYKRICAPAF